MIMFPVGAAVQDGFKIGEPKPCLTSMGGPAHKDNSVSAWLALDESPRMTRPSSLCVYHCFTVIDKYGYRYRVTCGNKVRLLVVEASVQRRLPNSLRRRIPLCESLLTFTWD
ncbi:hypothetical protein L1D52_19960 [Vibrio brasiliensis]|uniref:hypothetical protein n=1 Tax=Vibrio brasiliensis TaxID=170652 RepID=UPI001EFEEDFD|nr:hypothetical protein [Vibrio brasiliensis]MCG9784626.1 hypothetical protein [Vibrio brasiliensis]